MSFDPVRPTVAGLLAARRTSAFISSEPVRTPGGEGLLVEAVSRAIRSGVAIIRRPVVETPLGRRTGLFALTTHGRRIAVLLADASAADPARNAALFLVFGPYDAVYLVEREDLVQRAPALASDLAHRESSLFTAAGATSLELCAPIGPIPSRPGIPAGDRAARPSGTEAKPGTVRAMRINRPAEWAGSFESAMQEVEARRRYARSA